MVLRGAGQKILLPCFALWSWGREESLGSFTGAGGQSLDPFWGAGLTRKVDHVQESHPSQSVGSRVVEGPLGWSQGAHAALCGELQYRRDGGLVSWGLRKHYGFPGDSNDKESAHSAGDAGSIPGSGRSAGEGNSNPLQYSCLGNPVGQGAWWAAVHEVAKSQTWLRD